MRFFLVLLGLFVLAGAVAQVPVDPVEHPLDVRPFLVKDVVGLSFNASSHTQEGVFDVSVTMGAPPPGDFYLYSWSSQDGALAFDDPSAASTRARSSVTGIFYITCGVSQVRLGWVGMIPMLTLVADGVGSQECAAIGGPIGVSVAGNEKPTYNHDRNDKAKSWYMTYYRTGEETTHDATMTIDGQPTITRNGILKGTTISWTLPGNTATTNPKTTSFAANGGIASQPLSLLVKATGTSKDGEPKVHFHFDDGVISGDADDDSAETQYRFVDPMTQVVTWLPLVYEVSGHVPTSLVRATPPVQDEPITQPPGYTYWTDKARLKYVVKDFDGDAMPGVFVQERFTDANPLGLQTNKTNPFVWFSIRVAAVDSGLVDADDGTFQQFDFLQYTWPVGDAGTKMTTHAYYGGTKDASDSATTGILFGSATITFNAGQPGTAVQTDPVPPTPPTNP